MQDHICGSPCVWWTPGRGWKHHAPRGVWPQCQSHGMSSLQAVDFTLRGFDSVLEVRLTLVGAKPRALLCPDVGLLTWWALMTIRCRLSVH